MVAVGPVPVDMGQGFVGMGMGVRLPGIGPVVGMDMVLVVPVGMAVDQRFVGMKMRVHLPGKENDPAEHEDRGEP